MNILQFTELPQDLVDGMQIVHKLVFDEVFKPEKLIGKQNFCAFLAVEDDIVVGFKFGYEQEDGVFYSWLGGVHPVYQQRGIASRLMEAQHTWCQQQGYTRIRTYGRNEKKAMLIVNLKAGFDIVHTFIDDKGRHKIVFEKDLLQ
ncbi:GNAT family N-acetyltransferase [Solibacillus sp. CAU 1738]|uniref:GNAT family N-acetyltransferase n=1 Tax=Solibacillus sp. CAU 1738 TaxID=3140363 RepID=UPI0032616177